MTSSRDTAAKSSRRRPGNRPTAKSSHWATDLRRGTRARHSPSRLVARIRHDQRRGRHGARAERGALDAESLVAAADARSIARKSVAATASRRRIMRRPRAGAAARRRRATTCRRRNTSFVGRNTDIERIATALTSNRLVTLLGTGGVGKTRFALEVARRCLERYCRRRLVRRSRGRRKSGIGAAERRRSRIARLEGNVRRRASRRASCANVAVAGARQLRARRRCLRQADRIGSRCCLGS